MNLGSISRCGHFNVREGRAVRLDKGGKWGRYFSEFDVQRARRLGSGWRCLTRCAQQAYRPYQRHALPVETTGWWHICLVSACHETLIQVNVPSSLWSGVFFDFLELNSLCSYFCASRHFSLCIVLSTLYIVHGLNIIT